MSHSTENREVLHRVGHPHLGEVFPIEGVQDPVTAVFNPPMGSDRLPQGRSICWQTCQVADSSVQRNLGGSKKDVIWSLEVETFLGASVELVLNLLHVFAGDG